MSLVFLPHFCNHLPKWADSPVRSPGSSLGPPRWVWRRSSCRRSGSRWCHSPGRGRWCRPGPGYRNTHPARADTQTGNPPPLIPWSARQQSWINCLSSFNTHRCKSVRDKVNGHILSQGRVHWPNLLGDEPRAIGAETLVEEVQAESSLRHRDQAQDG